MSAQAKAAAKPDLPKRHNPIANLFPTHVISLEALEPALLSRCLALGEQEQAAAAAGGKPVAAASAGKGKTKEPAGPSTHNNDKDFQVSVGLAAAPPLLCSGLLAYSPI